MPAGYPEHLLLLHGTDNMSDQLLGNTSRPLIPKKLTTGIEVPTIPGAQAPIQLFKTLKVILAPQSYLPYHRFRPSMFFCNL